MKKHELLFSLLFVLASVSCFGNKHRTPNDLLIDACRDGRADLITSFIKDKDIFNIDFNYALWIAGKYTPLMVACVYNHPDVIKALLQEKSVKIDQKDRFGLTALMIACQHNPEVVEDLIEAGADPNVQSVNAKTALTFALGHNLQVVPILISGGADLNYGGPNEWTPLIYTCITNEKATCLQLIEAGANINLCDNKYGGTPLMYACQFTDYSDKNTKEDLYEIVQALIYAGADVNTLAHSYSNVTALILACEHNPQLVPLLLENGVDINRKATNGMDAFNIAKEFNLDLVPVLQEALGVINSEDGGAEELAGG